jgi:hypothetical protein
MCGNNTGDVVILHLAGSLKDTYSVLARAPSTTVPAIKSANEAPERSKLQALRCALVTHLASAHHANARAFMACRGMSSSAVRRSGFLAARPGRLGFLG